MDFNALKLLALHQKVPYIHTNDTLLNFFRKNPHKSVMRHDKNRVQGRKKRRIFRKTVMRYDRKGLGRRAELKIAIQLSCAMT
jgi:hypothetical protein